MRNEKGQLLVGVIVLMLVVAIIVPAMVLYVQHESRWSMKATHNMIAFQLAEAGIDKGFRKISESTTTWENGQNGIIPSGFLFSQKFDDLNITGGSYAVSISSGPEDEQVTIISIGRYKLSHSTEEVRALHAVFRNSPLGDTAVRGKSTISISGSNTTVQWGAVVSPQSITVDVTAGTNGKSPQYWSAANITMDNDGPGGINCDSPSQTAPSLPGANCWQWHSYEPNIPPDPNIDPGFYSSSATLETSGCPPGGVSNSCFFEGDQSFGGNNTPCYTTTASNAYYCGKDKVIYVNGNLTVTSTIYVKGTLFVTGNLTLPSGNAGAGRVDTPFPKKAWLQYMNNWDYYIDHKDDDSPAVYWDPYAKANLASPPSINSAYNGNNGVAKTAQLDKVIVQGFLYIGKNLSAPGGAGQSVVIGAVYVVGTVTLGTNNIHIYYSEEAGAQIKTTQIFLSRVSWRDIVGLRWPAL